MTRVSVVYHSNRGHTAALAEAVAVGARSVEGVTVHLLRIPGERLFVRGEQQGLGPEDVSSVVEELRSAQR